MCVSTARGVSLRARRICTGYSCGGILAHFFAALTWNFIRRSSKKCLTTSSPATASHLSCHSQLAGLLGDRCSRDVGAITTKKKINTKQKHLLTFHWQVPFRLVQGPWKHYLTKRTVSLQKDSSQLGPGTTSAHSGKRWWGRVTLSVKWNSKSAAVTSVSSRITHEDVKSGVNLPGKADRAGVVFPLLGWTQFSEVILIPKNTK